MPYDPEVSRWSAESQHQPQDKVPPVGTTTAPYAPYPPYSPYPHRQRRRVPWYAWLIGGIITLFVLAALLGAAAAQLRGNLAWVYPLPQRQAISDPQTFAVTGAPTLTISDPAGTVSIARGGDAQVQVQVTKQIGGRDVQAHTAFEGMTVQIQQDGNAIAVIADIADSTPGIRERNINLTVTVPQTTHVTVNLSAGSLSVDGITGAVKSTVNAGETAITHTVLMGKSTLTSETGSIHLQGSLAPGASLSEILGVGDASLLLPTSTSARLTAQTNVGNVEVSGWPLAPQRIGTVGARVQGAMGDGTGGTISVRVQTGKVSITQAG